MAPRESPRPKRRDRSAPRPRRPSRNHRRSRPDSSSKSSSQALSEDSLARLNQLNNKASRRQEIAHQKLRRKEEREIVQEKLHVDKARRHHRKRRRRVVSGALLEEGRGHRLRGIRGGYDYPRKNNRRSKKWICKIERGVSRSSTLI